jgi:hypothetical protein
MSIREEGVREEIEARVCPPIREIVNVPASSVMVTPSILRAAAAAARGVANKKRS